MTGRVVLASGVFDVLHSGHIAYLTECRKYGDKLVVAVTADEYVNKGPGRPMFTARDRAAALAALRLVDDVRVVDGPSVVSVINELHPAVYAKGQEYGTFDLAGNLQAEIAAVEDGGGTFVLTDTMRGSSTKWLNQQSRPWPKSAEAWLESVRREIGMRDVMEWFGLASTMSIAVVGEQIVDEYVYVEPLGKSAKETLVAFATDGSDRWPGGGEVVAAHMRSYCGSVTWHGGDLPAVLKRRYVQKAFTHKVFQTVQMAHGRGGSITLEPTDAVVVADFGHGLFPSQESCRALLDQADWVGLTVQSNSANWGFNVVTKWPRADYVVIDENEAQLAFHRKEPGESLVTRLQMALGADVAAITMGHRGSVLVRGNEIERVPALTDHAVDRLGAGDAFLAWTAPFACREAPLKLIGLIGSAAAALHVGKPGNPPLAKAEVLGFLKAVLT